MANIHSKQKKENDESVCTELHRDRSVFRLILTPYRVTGTYRPHSVFTNIFFSQDMYTLDTTKLDSWSTIIESDLQVHRAWWIIPSGDPDPPL